MYLVIEFKNKKQLHISESRYRSNMSKPFISQYDTGGT